MIYHSEALLVVEALACRGRVPKGVSTNLFYNKGLIILGNRWGTSNPWATCEQA